MALLTSASASASTRLLCPSQRITRAPNSYTPRCQAAGEEEERGAECVSRRSTLLRGAAAVAGLVALSASGECSAVEAKESAARAKFYVLEGSSGVKALDIRQGTGAAPAPGDQVEVHYYGRLAAKQGWRFDSTYDHKDAFGNPEPFVFTVGDAGVIGGLNAAVRSMREGGVRRVVIPPSQGYQDTRQGPVPPDYFDRQRLYTTIFNQTRLANGEGDTLGTLIFDIELLKVRKPS